MYLGTLSLDSPAKASDQDRERVCEAFSDGEGPVTFSEMVGAWAQSTCQELSAQGLVPLRWCCALPSPNADGSRWSNLEPEQCGQGGHMHRERGIFNLYAECIMRNAGLEETQARIKIAALALERGDGAYLLSQRMPVVPRCRCFSGTLLLFP